ncbi:MAG: cation transporter [Bacteroidales bacterium]|nr:cation transporter [Bacteroidales bacterium]
MTEKVKTARLSIISNSSLIVIKLLAGLISGSVSIISEAIHSGMDLLAAIIAFFSVKMSDIPPDREHPYGHGKFENVSGVVEAVLIFIAAGWIIYEAVHKMIAPGPIENIGIGAAVMAVSAIVNFLVSRRLYQVAKKTDSIALEADALHLKTDVYTSVGVAVGLSLLWITGWKLLDPLVAIAVALMIIRESYLLLRNAFSPLLDSSLSEEETNIIHEVIQKRGFSFHHLRTRKSGRYRFADLHLELPENMILTEVHKICDEIEVEIERRINDIDIEIHAEPMESQQIIS